MNINRKRKHFFYTLILILAMLFPWIASGFDGEYVVARVSLGMLAAIFLGSIIAFFETMALPVAYRLGVGLALGTAFFLNWAIPAVGVLEIEGHPADLMYTGVIATGIFLAIITRFSPRGMAQALVAMAGAQMLVAVIALLAGMHQSPVSSVPEILGLNGLFAMLWLSSAWLFWRAAHPRHTGNTA